MKRLVGVVLLLLAACNRAAPPDPVEKPNVLLITIDTLRADRVGRGLTPAIDWLAARGTRFTKARSTAPLTLPSHTSILTGSLPRKTACASTASRSPAPRSRARFTRRGIGPPRSSAPTSGSPVRPLEGFDTYDDRVQRDASGAARLEAERRGDIVVDAALPWLGR